MVNASYSTLFVTHHEITSATSTPAPPANRIFDREAVANRVRTIGAPKIAKSSSMWTTFPRTNYESHCGTCDQSADVSALINPRPHQSEHDVDAENENQV